MKPESTSKRFPASDEDRQALIDDAPDSASDPECPYDPADPAAVEAFWSDAVVQAPRGQREQHSVDGERGKAVTLHLSRPVLEYFRAGEKGWQRRIDLALRDYVENHR
jgi:uncharacterized protein (DUF4415 family)